MLCKVLWISRCLASRVGGVKRSQNFWGKPRD